MYFEDTKLEKTENQLANVLDWLLLTCRNTSQSDLKDERYRRYNDLVWSLRDLKCSIHCDCETGRHKVTVNGLK